MLYKGKRANPGAIALKVILGSALLCAVVLVTTLLSGKKPQEPLEQTVAAAALPVTHTPKATESTLRIAVPAPPPTADILKEQSKADEAGSEKNEQAKEQTQTPANSHTKSVGIVNAADVNMREAPTDGKVLATLTKGTAVLITGSKDDWYSVSYGGKTGYVAARLLDKKDKAEFSCLGKVSADALNVRTFPSASSGVICQVTRDTYVDVTGFEKGWFAVKTNYDSGYVNAEYLLIGVEKPAAKAPATQTPQTAETKTETTAAETTTTTTYSGTGAELAATAQQYLGYSYSYGGSGPSSFDCSGFTMYIYGLYGVSLPHGATGQYGYGTSVSQSELQPGDLVFFSYGGNAIGHVGIYVGDRNFIHASTYGVGVITSSLDGGSYPSRYVGARRIL